MKKLLAVMLSMMMVVSLAACSGGGSEEASKDSQSKQTDGDDQKAASGDKTVGIILKTLNSEYWSCMKAGIEQAEKDFGVTVVLQGPASETAFDEQLSMIETMLSTGQVDALVLAPLQPDTAAQAVSAASIPVLAVDTTFEADNLVSYIGISNESATTEGGKYMGEKIGEDSNVVILGGVQGDLTSEDRISGRC